MRRPIRVLLLFVSLAVVVTTNGLTLSYETAQYAAKVGETTSAEIRLHLADQATFIRASSDPDVLFRADLDYVGDVLYDATEGRHAIITVKENSRHKVYAGVRDLEWAIDLNPNIPTSLSLTGGEGDLDADLRPLHLTNLDVELDTGDTLIKLPSRGERLTMRLDTGAGNVTVRIPDGTILDFSPLQVGRGEVLLKVGHDVDFDLSLELSTGRLILDVPSDAAVQVNLVSAGKGQFKREMRIPKVRVGWTRDSGIWQTDGYEQAAARISLTVRLMGGELILR